RWKEDSAQSFPTCPGPRTPVRAKAGTSPGSAGRPSPCPSETCWPGLESGPLDPWAGIPPAYVRLPAWKSPAGYSPASAVADYCDALLRAAAAPAAGWTPVLAATSPPPDQA